MRPIRKDILLKIKHKNKGNIRLSKAIDELISAFENSHWRTKEEIITGRPDADQVNNEGFFIFNMPYIAPWCLLK